jgi:hypothetical protein
MDSEVAYGGTEIAVRMMAMQIKSGVDMNGLDRVIASGEVGGGSWKVRRGAEDTSCRMRVFSAGIRLHVTAHILSD